MPPSFTPSHSPARSSTSGLSPSRTTYRRQSANGSTTTATTTSEATTPSRHRTTSTPQSTSEGNRQAETPNNRHSSSCVQVAVRVRPLIGPAEAATDQCIRCLSKTALQIGDRHTGPSFTFDRVFGPSTGQEAFFQERCLPLVESVLQGYHATCFAYGQTGSGKTFTILGPAHSNQQEHRDQAGVLPRALGALFDRLQKNGTAKTTTDWQVRVQFLELYGEDLRDLLVTKSGSGTGSAAGGGGWKKLTIRDLGQDEPEVVGATWTTVTTAEQALDCLHQGQLRRVTAATAMNATSSRSHAILSVAVEQQECDDSEGNENTTTVKRSKFSFVDLAGSERQKRTGATGVRLKEGIDINKGLLVLGNVISALGDPKKAGKTFVPYRDSKLTRLLKGSLGGNHKTLMIACVSPAATNLEESLNCLRYANRAKNIQNSAVVNLDPQSRRVADLQAALQAVATDWLRAADGKSLELSRERIQAILSNQGGPPQGLANLLQPPTNRSPRENNDDPLSLQQQLDQTMLQLQDSQRHHDAAEQELAKLRASHIAVELDGSQSALVDKVAEYELEVTRLRRALAAVDLTTQPQLGALDQAAEEELRSDRERLLALQSSMSALSEGSTAVALTPARSVSSQSIHEQEKMEEAQMQEWTAKYIGKEDDEDDVDATTTSEHADDTVVTTRQEVEHVQEELDVLSKSIAAKEDIIEQLKVTKEKYEGMREFYEVKLKVMEETLAEREVERGKLLLELREVKENDGLSKELETQLQEKDKHIADLRRKHKELFNLTKVSSRNDTEILRLQTDVNTMKRKKVDLQKQLSLERKSHANEMKKVKKTVMQQDRELNKWKKVSGQHEQKAQRANQLAKTRLEELGQLRNKYKGAEKQLRLQSLKQGVMAKAGLDPVIVGRRGGNGKTTSTENQRARNVSPPVDPDSMRDYFDQKVADIARRENLVDKLAAEWEEHFGLATRRQELVNSPDADGATDAVQSIDVQLRFKEDRIRQLAKRLGKNPPGTEQANDRADDEFLYGSDFAKLSRGCTPEQAKSVAARVLFGMIVRERRRVAALARTASALDERVQAAQEAAELSKTALRSYEEEQRLQYAEMARDQQDHILSLMDMVKSGSERSSVVSVDHSSSADGTPELLVLANERIALLESQVEDLQSGVAMSDSYRENLEDLEAALDSKSRECSDLHTNLSDLRSALRQIREAASQYSGNSGDYGDMYGEILRTVEDALHPSHASSPHAHRGHHRHITAPSNESVERTRLTPRLKKHVELMHTSDSGEDGEQPEWANEIMADLAFIADGKLPPAMESTTSVLESSSQLETNTVFDRLANPKTFTGTQRRAQLKRDQDSASRPTTRSSSGHEERAAKSEEIAGQLDRIIVPGSKANSQRPDGLSRRNSLDTSPLRTADDRGSGTGEKDATRSVFDRLVSPSHFTGTQKEKFLSTRARRDRSAEVVADRLLDDLLQSAEEIPHPESDSLNNSRSMYTDYTQQDVFERLQKTTTQAYDSKHVGTPSTENGENNNRAASLSGNSGHGSRHAPERDFAIQDVFERLQKTTTEAYAKKTKR